MLLIADRTAAPKAKKSVVTGSLLAQQDVEDIPALATAVPRSGWPLVSIVGSRDAIPIDQPLTRLSAVRHQEPHLGLRCVAAIDHVALGIRGEAGEAEAYGDSSDG